MEWSTLHAFTEDAKKDDRFYILLMCFIVANLKFIIIKVDNMIEIDIILIIYCSLKF